MINGNTGIRRVILAVLCSVSACSSAPSDRAPAMRGGEALRPTAAYRTVGDVTLGEPLAVSIDFQGTMFIADGIPSRIVRFDPQGSHGLEFQSPTRSPGFRPCDCRLQGFFLYAVDEVNRTVLRFDKDGVYRDILLAFGDDPVGGGRVSPYGLDVDRSGGIAVTDVENHRVLVYDAYLSLELAFGSYGSHQGQFDSPQGIFIAEDGHLLVADTGNRRIQEFDRAGAFLRMIPASPAGSPLAGPRRAVADEHGAVYVADPEAGAVFVFDRNGDLVSSLYPEDSAAFQPTDAAIAEDGSLFVTDAASRTLYVFKVMYH